MFQANVQITKTEYPKTLKLVQAYAKYEKIPSPMTTETPTA